MSGTSMPCPHVDGITALIHSAHPTSTPAAIKSAIIIAVEITNHSGRPIMDGDKPAGVFATGAGHVNPERAINPGLVYDIRPNEYITHLCTLGVDTPFLTILKTWTRLMVYMVEKGVQGKITNRDNLRVRTVVSPISNGTGDSFLPGATPCLPSAIPERFSGGLSCQDMTVRLTGCGLCQSEIQFKGNQCSFARGRVKGPVRHKSPVQQLPDQWPLSTPPVNSQAEVSVSTAGLDTTGCGHGPTGRANHQIATAKRSICFASSSPRPVDPIPGETPNVQEGTDIPTGPAPPPISPQLSKVPINLADSPFEFEVDHTALKLSKLEKLFKKSHEVKSIPDIEDGYTDTAVTLPDRFKMPHIDRFDGSGDPMVHLSLFSDVLRPMGLTRLQKLSLFGRTLSGIAAIWYAKLEDSVKRSWEEMAEAFVAQYSYNTQIEITTRDLETTRQEPKESFSEFVARWRAKASMMTIRPTDKDQIRMVVRNLQPKLMQKMIVLPFPTFSNLHEMGVQIEDAMKQGLIDNDREQPGKAFFSQFECDHQR
ncbi:hypothetical protein HYC85_028988 [Camellia sinensis]|uniref:Retrotransposon gag domain-containing protein n=1 Tax=Camellia sinensis TaxID=4442 RepID=A0A7J7FXE6_CAMSI|nr:hypothetical protein HYC85_028988 [Camellia sinensis]